MNTSSCQKLIVLSLLKNVIATTVFTRIAVTITAPNLPLQMRNTIYITNNVNFAKILLKWLN